MRQHGNQGLGGFGFVVHSQGDHLMMTTVYRERYTHLR